MTLNTKFIVIFSAIFSLAGCLYTPKKEKEIKDEIFEVKAKVLELERSTQEKGQHVDASTRRNAASTHTELERVNLELQRIKGELDAVKIAVRTGEVPGADPESDSLAKRVKDLETRLEAVELAAAASRSPSTTAAKNSNDPKKISVVEIRTAFNSKKFSYVAANADPIIQRLKTKGTKEEIAYYEAESLFRLNRFREAALKYADFVEQYTTSQRISHSKLRLGDCFKQLGDNQAAKSYYKEILTKFPKSEEASRAKEQLDALESKGASRSSRSAEKVKYSQKTNVTEAKKRG